MPGVAIDGFGCFQRLVKNRIEPKGLIHCRKDPLCRIAAYMLEWDEFIRLQILIRDTL